MLKPRELRPAAPPVGVPTLAVALAAVLAGMLPAAQAARPTTPPGSRVEMAAVSLPSAQEIAIYALGLTGVGYRYGGSTPERGLDCSGFVRYVFQQVTGATLPRTARDMARMGGRVVAADLQTGDLVFFNTLHAPFSHVGIYVGDDRFIHAPRSGGEVEVVTMTQDYWRKRYDGARRLVGVLPDSAPTARAVAAMPAAATPNEGPFGAADR